jgi:hypothetical protein
MLGIEVKEHHISIAHRLPPTRKIRNRIIVKVVHRNMKEEFYKRRSKLIGKKSKDIPSIAKEYGKTIHESNSIFINEQWRNYYGLRPGEPGGPQPQWAKWWPPALGDRAKTLARASDMLQCRFLTIKIL